MNTNKNTFVTEYIKKIDNMLPYPNEEKKKLLEALESDVLEALKDSTEKDPEKVFGNCLEVARNVSQSQDWSIKKAGYGIRTFAYLIDFFLSMLLGSVILIFGLVIFYISVISEDIVIGLIGFILYFSAIILFITFILGYFIILEGLFSTTIGKKIFGMIVVDQSGIKISWSQSIVRNLSKLNGTFLILDLLVGKYYQKTDHQRAMETIANTIVIRLF